MKKIALILALIMAAMTLFAACGSESSNDSGDGKDNSAETNKEETGTPPADTWENAQGQSGKVEYVYEGKDLVKTVFKLGDSEKIWRTVEHLFSDDSGMSAWSEKHFDANGTLMFDLSITKHPAEEGKTERVPEIIYGYDRILDETSSDMRYGTSGATERTLRKNSYTGAQNYWVVKYGSNGLPVSATVYYRDGVRKSSWRFFSQDGKLAYAQCADDYMNFDYADTYKLNKDGNELTFVWGYASVKGNTVTNFNAKSSDDGRVTITLKYDSDGNVTELTYPRENTTKTPIIEKYTYEGGNRVKCTFTEITGYENDNVGTFELNANGTVASADYGYLNGSRGSGDTTYYRFEYYDNGVVSNVKAYRSSEIEEGEDYPDIEWERDFYESGKLKMECKYDSSDMDYREEYYDENGERTGSKRGTYTEDGTKTEEVID